MVFAPFLQKSTDYEEKYNPVDIISQSVMKTMVSLAFLLFLQPNIFSSLKKRKPLAGTGAGGDATRDIGEGGTADHTGEIVDTKQEPGPKHHWRGLKAVFQETISLYNFRLLI